MAYSIIFKILIETIILLTWNSTAKIIIFKKLIIKLYCYEKFKENLKKPDEKYCRKRNYQKLFQPMLSG